MCPVDILGNLRQLHLVALSAMVDENHPGKDTILLPGIIVIFPEFQPRHLIENAGHRKPGDCASADDQLCGVPGDEA